MMDDSEIILLAQGGRTECLDILVRRYRIPLYTVCRKLAGRATDADELFQDTWVRALRTISTVSVDRPFLPWLVTVCINLYRDRYRKRKRWFRRLVSYGNAPALETRAACVGCPNPGPDHQLIARETRALVRRALERLDEDHRLPLLMLYYQRLKIATIAEVLGIPEGTVKSRLANGRRKLAAIIEETRHE